MPLSTIGSNQITDGAIAVADVADGSITTAKLADNAVTTAKITDGNITTAKVADDAITGAKIENTPSIANGLTMTDGDITFADGHGINFASASGDASGMASELLDDYEEGTFTPAWSSTGSTFQYSVQQGNYTKIGHRVVFTIYVQLDGGGNSFSGNSVTLGGLPFTSGEAMIYPVIGRFLDINGGSGYSDPAVLLSSGGTTMALRQYGDNVAGVASSANVLSSSSGQVWISGSYKV